jgi:hypothetical protein
MQMLLFMICRNFFTNRLLRSNYILQKRAGGSFKVINIGPHDKNLQELQKGKRNTWKRH